MDTDIGVEVGVNAHTLNTCQLVLPCRYHAQCVPSLFATDCIKVGSTASAKSRNFAHE